MRRVRFAVLALCLAAALLGCGGGGALGRTTKAKGVSYMENKLLWHYRAPMGDDMTKALAELDNCQ